MEDPIIPFELKRMFLGEAPLLFYVEIAVRTVITFFPSRDFTVWKALPA